MCAKVTPLLTEYDALKAVEAAARDERWHRELVLGEFTVKYSCAGCDETADDLGDIEHLGGCETPGIMQDWPKPRSVTEALAALDAIRAQEAVR